MEKSIKNIVLLFLLLVFSSTAIAQQASLTIENRSIRSMTVKIMKGSSGKGTLFTTITISANSKETVYFSQTGYYFTKTKAVLNGKDPVYQKGQPFKVVNDDTGYSVLTLTFVIKESAVPQVTGGQQISKSEFDQN